MPTPERLARMRSVLEHRQRDLQVVIEHIRDPHNASAILRTCDALGVHTVHLLYTDQPSPEISRTVSSSSHQWLDIRRHSDPQSLADALHAEGVPLYVTRRDERAKALVEVDFTGPAAVVFGNEHRGCSDEVAAVADGALWIPMVGMVESFNVSVSAAIVLAEAYRQRAAAGTNAPRWDGWRQQILDGWLAREG
ncbi:MAG: tRNA methyltransferase [Dehalococcoidia bacterium]|nr:MAG: tRNA methyltransferase [Dehalococcoidia bacterium]